MTTLLTFLKTPIGFGACFALVISFLYTTVAAQTAISGVINNYAAVTSFNPCANRITVNSTAGFRPGSVVLIIQMQGATINEGNNTNYGSISNYGGAGVHEKAIIAEIQGNDITFTHDLINFNSYNIAGKVQLVTIPQFGNVVVNEQLTAEAWDGETGGVLAFEASGTVTLNADITLDGRGFRGGGITNDPNNDIDCNPATRRRNYFYESTSFYSAFKGEGIARSINRKELGRGPQANGGGGGNDHNSGGGGGGNAGMGGLGGENNSLACSGLFPGVGGNSLNFDSRIFLGGGGGGGHSNNNLGTAGGNGGGIIYIGATNFNGNGRNITANGTSPISEANGDGGGGGGAGGTIIINVSQFTPQDLFVQANGGNGGNVNTRNSTRCFGPGGGGGGGAIFINREKFPEDVKKEVDGGSPGRNINNPSCGNNDARSGSNGIESANFNIPISDKSPVCFTPTPIELLYFRAKTGSNHVQLEWATAREINNNYFSIERSEDGVSFYEIGQMPGKGNYVGVSVYTHQDNSPLYGIAYYRIKQIDYDGKFTYTHIVAVEYSSDEAVISMFPNPIGQDQQLNVKIYSPVEGSATLQIYTVLGNQLHHQQYTLRKGTQSLELSMNGYPAGIYVVRIQIGRFYKIQKIEVLR